MSPARPAAAVRRARRGAVGLLAVLGGCTKVPLVDIEAGFQRSDVAWFAEEETLFVFYELTAEQGLSENSVLEIAYVTDAERVSWTPLSSLPTVHEHQPVDCGPTALCGSTSIALPDEPRDVRLRLRYHVDGPLALEPPARFNVVGPGAPHDHRSYVVYGVFDETNSRVQWRGRHLFPTLRNEEATALGLRRELRVHDVTSGATPASELGNPYLYGVPCRGARRELDIGEVSTTTRAVFHPGQLPVEASTDAELCAQATVTDATGSFTTTAHARKNPEVRPAFPVLRSPVAEARPLHFYIGPCDGPINARHADFQRERLNFPGSVPTICTEGWTDEGWVDSVADRLGDAVENARPDGEDMVLSIVLHREDGGVADKVEEALALVAPEERHRSTPRLAGAFVYDSDVRDLELDEAVPVVLWCPTAFPTNEADVVSTAALTCAIAPDDTDVELGPLSFGQLPVLPSRERYLDFVNTYSEREAGEVTDVAFLAPRFATTTDHVDLGSFGVVSFLNDEQVPARSTDAFSYCPPDQPVRAAFRTEFMRTAEFQELVEEACATGSLPESYCVTAALGVLPLELMPELHNTLPALDYELGLFWEFPFLLRMVYEAYVAGSISALGLSVPFGVAQNGEQYLGTQAWLSEEVDLSEILTHCTRFCDHPTFDSAGVYQVQTLFRWAYQTDCYTPAFPTTSSGGFPLDP